MKKFGINFRPARQNDAAAFYDISHRTGNDGADASDLYSNKQLMGDIYSVPYLALAPDLCFVAEDELGVLGYVVGTLDSVAFASLLEVKWWPQLRAIHVEPDTTQMSSWSEEQRCIDTIFHPEVTDDAIINTYPAHMHMNLLARAQGKGIGAQLCSLWLDTARRCDVNGVHVGTSATNARATHFWKKCGFSPLGTELNLSEGETVWLGQKL